MNEEYEEFEEFEELGEEEVYAIIEAYRTEQLKRHMVAPTD